MKAKQTKTQISATAPRPDGALAAVLSAIAMGIILVAVIIDKFIYPFGQEPLSPIIAQILILLVPAYVLTVLAFPQKSTAEQMREIGIRRLRAEYLFFLIFTAFFAICTSFMLNMIFGGVKSAADGFTILGAFRAGEQEFSIGAPYLIATYALIPAFVEEFAFRGVIYHSLPGMQKNIALIISSVLYALFFFSPAQIPEAIVIGIILCFVLRTTGSLVACMLVHFVVNLYRLFLQTNISQYLITSHNRALLIIIALLAFLLSAALFFSESARIYRARSAREKEFPERARPAKKLDVKVEWQRLVAVFSFKPTLIASIVAIALYIAIIVVGNI
jgi:membrane protease YdiL (CAAX protease family)